MKTTLVDQIIRPKTEGGCHWVNKRRVIVRLVVDGVPVKELWWCLGATGWAGRGCTDYYNAELRTAEKKPVQYRMYDIGGARSITKVIAEKGKLSAKRIRSLAEVIDAFFGCAVSGDIDIHKTLIVEPSGRP